MKSPYKVLFSNDTTNIETCSSAFSPGSNIHRDPAQGGKWTYVTKPFTERMLEASVDETAGTGIDVHMLQPGLGWVPWWKSEVYPFAKHVEFMKRQFGMTPDQSGYAKYMAEGGDMVAAFVKSCRKNALAPFVSFRLNDSHGHEFVNAPRETLQGQGWLWHVLTPIHVGHPEWRLRADINDWGGRVLNWAIPEVRAAKFAFIRELVENYDLDGFELDYMRHCNFFRPEETTSAQRLKIMTDFIRDVRSVLDRAAGTGRRRWLCARIPAFLAAHDSLGIDVGEFAAAGVDMFNLSHYYFTEQEGDHESIRRRLPDSSVYAEMCHCTTIGKILTVDHGYDNMTYRRTTANQYYTTAHLAYARGLDGVSTFNFVYYREHGAGERGPFNEPPFEIHRGCSDPAFVARQPQHYFLGNVWNEPAGASHQMNDPEKPWEARHFQSGQTITFKLDMASPAGGWKKGGRLRIQSQESLGDSRWTCRFNFTKLKSTPDCSEPYDNPYPPLLGAADQHRAWIVPTSLPKDGMNAVEITLAKGDKPVTLAFLDLAVE